MDRYELWGPWLGQPDMMELRRYRLRRWWRSSSFVILHIFAAAAVIGIVIGIAMYNLYRG